MSITSGVITIFTYVDLHLAMHDFSGQTAPSGQTAWHCTTQISKPKPSVFGTHVCSPIYSEIFVQPPFAPFHFSPGLVICDISIASPVQLQKPTPLAQPAPNTFWTAALPARFAFLEIISSDKPPLASSLPRCQKLIYIYMVCSNIFVHQTLIYKHTYSGHTAGLFSFDMNWTHISFAPNIMPQ